MLERIEARMRELADRAEARTIARVADRIAAEFPDLSVSNEARSVVLEGRGLSRRLLSDARLRWIGAVLR